MRADRVRAERACAERVRAERVRANICKTYREHAVFTSYKYKFPPRTNTKVQRAKTTKRIPECQLFVLDLTFDELDKLYLDVSVYLLCVTIDNEKSIFLAF